MTVTLQNVRVGIVGLGRMGRFHLQKCLTLPGVQVVGCYEPEEGRARATHSETGVAVFPNLADLLFEVDAVIIASPTHTHGTLARQALNAGAHVLVEKPITSHIGEAESIVRLAKEKSLVLQVGMVERFRLAALAKDAVLTPALFIETHRLTPHHARESIDVVSDLMIHDLDLALSLVAEDPFFISAIGMKVTTSQIDLANARLEFPSGAVMSLNASRVSTEPLRKMRVFTSEGYASFDFQKNVAAVFRHTDLGVQKNVSDAPGLDSLLEQARDFFRCIRERRRPLVAGEDGLRALRCAQIVIDKIAERERLFPSSSRDNDQQFHS